MAKTEKLIAFIDFLREMEQQRTPFTVQQASKATSYVPNTVNKYINEKLNGRFVVKNDSHQWVCEGISKISNDEFIRIMSQSLKAKTLTPNERFYHKLVERSLDAFTLSLEIYNRPSLNNRVEAFAIMIINAWELLLKAETLKAQGYDAVFGPNGKSISISEALSGRLQENDPVRKNLETLVNLRDQATHLLIPELQPQLSRLFQANVLNFQTRYRNEIGNSPLAGQSVGMLSLILDGPETEIGVIRENYGENTAKEVISFLSNFNKLNNKCDSDKFSISIDYKLALTRNPNKSDLTLNIGNNGEKAIIIRETKDLDITHPYTNNEAIKKINNRQASKITQYSFQAILSKHKIKKNNKSDKHNFTDKHRYSDKFIDWFVENLNQPNWLKSAIEHYKSQLKKNSKAKSEAK